MKINKRAFAKLKKHILEEPKRYNQGVPFERVDPEYKGNPPCGTVGCLLGWASFLAKKADKKSAYQCNIFSFERGRKWLGLSVVQAQKLYQNPDEYSNQGWARKYQDAYLKARTPLARAKVAARVLDRVVETNGEDF